MLSSSSWFKIRISLQAPQIKQDPLIEIYDKRREPVGGRVVGKRPEESADQHGADIHPRIAKDRCNLISIQPCLVLQGSTSVSHNGKIRVGC